MASLGTDQGLPGLRPASSHKQKETAHFLENAKPPLLKKKRVNKKALSTHSSPLTRKSTEDTDNDEEDTGAVNKTCNSDNDTNKANKDKDKSNEDKDKAEELDKDEVEEVKVKESTNSERSKHFAGRHHCH